MKTINELNKKWWYRLIKVIYLILFATALIGPVVAIIVEYKSHFDSTKSYVKCNDGRKINLQANNINLYSDYIGYYDDKTIKVWCLSNSELGEIARNIYPYSYSPFSDEEIGKRIRNNKNDESIDFLNKINIRSKNYELVPIYTAWQWIPLLGYSLLSICGAIIVFELIRRIFYYIVLGSLKPSKK